MTDTASTDEDSGTWKDLAEFEAGMQGWKGDVRSGDLHLTFAVPPGFKHDALVVTDYPGRKVRLKVEILVFDGWEVE